MPNEIVATSAQLSLSFDLLSGGCEFDLVEKFDKPCRAYSVGYRMDKYLQFQLPTVTDTKLVLLTLFGVYDSLSHNRLQL